MQSLQNLERVEVAMGTVVSRVPELLKARNWTPIDLIRRGMAYNTSYRVARGAIDITLETAVMLVDFFELSGLDEIFAYSRGDVAKEQQTGS